MSEQRPEYSTALVAAPEGMSLMQLGDVLSKSGYFQDAKGAAQAIVKVLAGRELGIGPIAAMTGINIIQGKVSVGANVMAAKVKGSKRYDYRVLELSDDRCRLEFFERSGDDWQSLGVSEFTKANAIAANTKNLTTFPRNMFFARAMSNGVKWYCPDISVSPMYTPDELGATVDYETGEIITSTATDVTPEPGNTNGGGLRAVQRTIERALGEPASNYDGPTTPASALAYVNQRVQVPYEVPIHMYNAIKQELGEFKWPAAGETDAWAIAIDAAIRHAERKAQPAGQTIAEQMDAGGETMA